MILSDVHAGAVDVHTAATVHMTVEYGPCLTLQVRTEDRLVCEVQAEELIRFLSPFFDKHACEEEFVIAELKELAASDEKTSNVKHDWRLELESTDDDIEVICE